MPLLQDALKQQAMQAALGSESGHLSWVYASALYGTEALRANDTSAHGDYDETTGCLFAAAS